MLTANRNKCCRQWLCVSLSHSFQSQESCLLPFLVDQIFMLTSPILVMRGRSLLHTTHTSMCFGRMVIWVEEIIGFLHVQLGQLGTSIPAQMGFPLVLLIPRELLTVYVETFIAVTFCWNIDLSLIEKSRSFVCYDICRIYYSGGQWAIVCRIFAGWLSGKCLLYLKDSFRASNIISYQLWDIGVPFFDCMLMMLAVVPLVPLESSSNFLCCMSTVIQHCKLYSGQLCFIPIIYNVFTYWYTVLLGL